MADPKKILIVGGGFTGLTAAWRLSANPEFSVTLLESSDQLGGLAGGFPLLGTSLEKAYHHLFLTETAILQLVDELKLGDKLMWCESSMGIHRGGRSYPFMSPMDVLRFKPCGLPGRLRLGAVALYLKYKRDWRGFTGQTAYRWMLRACGRDATEAVWEPLLKGKFDRFYKSISMAWLWARIHIRARSRGPGGGKEKLGYFRGGFAVVVAALESGLLRRGVRLQTRAAVEKFSATERAALVNGQWLPFDFCIFTGPSPALARLLPPGGTYESFARQLHSIEYLGAVCLVFVSDQDLGDYYWLNINEPDAPFLVFLNHTRLVGTDLYQGKHVYYIGTYAPSDHRAFSVSDAELADGWWSYLRKIIPGFDPARVIERHVFRFKAAQHIVDTTYQERIPPHRTPLPGLFLANFSQVFPQDRGTNWAVDEGNRIAAMICAEAGSASTAPATLRPEERREADRASTR